MRDNYPPFPPPPYYTGDENEYVDVSSEFEFEIFIEVVPSELIPPPVGDTTSDINSDITSDITSSELVPPPLTASELADIIQGNIVPPVEVPPSLTASEMAEIIATTETPTTSTYTAFEKPFEEYNVVEFSAFTIMIIAICSVVIVGCNIFKGKGGY